MENKSKKSKKDSIEIRFTVSANDGNLKKMLDKVPNGCYTDFTKTALRYYLKAVRDEEVECDFLKSDDLNEFRVNLKQQEPRLEDILRVIQACSVATVAQATAPASENVDVCFHDEENSNIDKEIDYEIDIAIEEDNQEDVTIKEDFTLNHTVFNF